MTNKMFDIRRIARISMLAPMTLISAYVTAQLRMSSLGAMNALNSNYVAAIPPSAPSAAIPPAALQPVGPLPAKPGLTIPGNAALKNPVGNASDILNKDVGIAYQSAYSWWMGYQDYKGAAQGLSFNADGTQVELGDYGVYLPVSASLTAAVNFFIEDSHFILFRDFPTKKVDLVIRGNQPIPLELVSDPGGYITYTPLVGSFKTTVTLNLK